MAWKVEYGREYYKNNREEVLKRNRERYAANPDKDRDKHLRRKYGITIDEYKLLLEEQGGVCKLCGGPPTGKGKKSGHLHVDHCHKTGRIRGLLCTGCNTGLGGLKESPELLIKAASYLSQS